ncbi:MAG TPA: hypothetical protein PLH27_01610 [bacterium]|nr:hypothetical protein [bacterium]HMW32850.1 hypothetical protein [bacterium]HMW35015.1 hypothetical protein [bacterium]HMY35911.1 hypothetical protein [bacterium]HMZ04043.1 hypothetical protein [bacterium]
MKKSIVLVLIGCLMVLWGCDDNNPYSPRLVLNLTDVYPDILYVSEIFGSQHINAIHDTARGDILDISVNDSELDPTWSADGRKFAYTNIHLFNQSTGQPLHSNIYIRDMDSSTLTPVTYSKYYLDTNFTFQGIVLNMRPDWSLMTNKMVFISNRDSTFDIYTTTITDTLYGDTTAVRLTDETDKLDMFCHPSWSPDGSKIVYTSSKTGNEEIWIMNSDGTGKTQLTDLNASIAGRPRFSPSGDKIAFYSSSSKNGNDSLNIFTMNPNGTGIQKVTQSGNNIDPAWTPDGNRIVYSKRTSSRGYIYLINRDGTEEKKMISKDSRAYYPIWRPAH